MTTDIKVTMKSCYCQVFNIVSFYIVGNFEKGITNKIFTLQNFVYNEKQNKCIKVSVEQCFSPFSFGNVSAKMSEASQQATKSEPGEHTTTGETTSIGSALKTWLAENKLRQFETQIQESKVSLEELLSMAPEQLELHLQKKKKKKVLPRDIKTGHFIKEKTNARRGEREEREKKKKKKKGEEDATYKKKKAKTYVNVSSETPSRLHITASSEEDEAFGKLEKVEKRVDILTERIVKDLNTLEIAIATATATTKGVDDVKEKDVHIKELEAKLTEIVARLEDIMKRMDQECEQIIKEKLTTLQSQLKQHKQNCLRLEEAQKQMLKYSNSGDKHKLIQECEKILLLIDSPYTVLRFRTDPFVKLSINFDLFHQVLFFFLQK
ncbi:structural maintenance of chromosomes protein 4 [Reticulomyxa filosa]|uniref:Structural maintenance of chromosomes protein 4 n=1 Tax=Reticulomyxa filosa TaxID=46433 RepID=X6P2H0_RETFI|nr:structural maintenance of chromosomes protein 4 [Reticulomyxa filosa]|eukprot:ETO32755.1 structural maintenance of chromosomes protein 4 [Reticulomyxa filosa]